MRQGVDFSDAWTEIIQTSTCPSCGLEGTAGRFYTTDGTPPAYAGLRCGDCATFIRWLPAPKNTEKRAPTGWSRAHWKRHDGGLLICSMCAAREGETRCEFVIHHRERVEDNPLRERDLYNTLPLCRDCHTIAEALRAHRLHVLGRSARDGGT